ncbi:uncharacterized protein LOC18443537 isoform X1 [Amborella trichopoda]|uniref:RRM domain-containing protein n=1 Tax=Amborella trichopoda TaxID=13333 RepID=U5D1H3_AMBTC|nr:uncharacterized protein LOC18443537 isoform X1 [Amborella trichopoda]ERN15252.1 hypothetical protein AMTR_s00056p00211180 [Amborella trichopoda]|eukprot:XP_006853785.1 uncharacterized protein LOC18443537 isoform X1 [Amborella trichopoda]
MDANAQAMAAQSMVSSYLHHQKPEPLPPPLYHHAMAAPPSSALIPPLPPAETTMSPVIQQRRPELEVQNLYFQQNANPNFVHTEQIKTLFISGLPDDVKAREIHNLFRRRYGFESCQLKYTGRGNQVVAFATFFDHHAAMMAMDALNGTVFDPQTGATLHIELARSNSRNKRQRGSEAYTIIDNREKVSKGDQEGWSSDGVGGSDEPSDSNPSTSKKSGLSSAQSGETADQINAQDSTSGAHNEQLGKPVAGETPLCSTLFIANLGPTCNHEELNTVLSKYRGFEMLKMQTKGGMPVAFADFQDISCSTEALKDLQGVLLLSSDRGGMHVEYAKSKMRRPQEKK